jgi:hypothetical protein
VLFRSLLRTDLRRFLEDLPILARRPSVSERAAKWAKRHKSIVAVGAIALLAISVIAGMWLQGLEHERTIRAAALTARVMDAEVRHLPDVLAEVAQNRAATDSVLKQVLTEPSTTPAARLRVNLALLPTNPASHVGPLKASLLNNPDLELTVLIARRLRPYLDNEQFGALIDQLVAIHRPDSKLPKNNQQDKMIGPPDRCVGLK